MWLHRKINIGVTLEGICEITGVIILEGKTKGDLSR